MTGGGRERPGSGRKKEKGPGGSYGVIKLSSEGFRTDPPDQNSKNCTTSTVGWRIGRRSHRSPARRRGGHQLGAVARHSFRATSPTMIHRAGISCRYTRLNDGNCRPRRRICPELQTLSCSFDLMIDSHTTELRECATVVSVLELVLSLHERSAGKRKQFSRLIQAESSWLRNQPA